MHASALPYCSALQAAMMAIDTEMDKALETVASLTSLCSAQALREANVVAPGMFIGRFAWFSN
jgi:hypothetical protein